jgi:hypothetical protein
MKERKREQELLKESQMSRPRGGKKGRPAKGLEKQILNKARGVV